MWALIDHHLDIRSPLRGWHSTAKLIGLGSLVLAAACARNVLTAGAMLVLSIFVVSLTKFPLGLLWRRLRSVILFIALFAALIALTADEEPTLSLGPIAVSQPGLNLAALLGAKAMSIALMAAALVATTPFSQLCHSLRRLGCPARVIQVTLLAYRMNFALGGEVESTRHALSARGFRWSPGRRTMLTVGHVLGSMFARSLDRAERLYDAMLARGYDGAVRCMPRPPVTTTDSLATVVAVLAAVALIGTQWWI